MTVREDAPFKRHQIVTHLENNRVQTRSYFAGNILAHPGYAELAEDYGDLREEFPVASHVTLNSFFMGTFIGLTEEKLDYIQKVVDDFFKDMK
jgi:CDP-6-deoxy-D-xylo-4-hexulose-3-dehydrase